MDRNEIRAWLTHVIPATLTEHPAISETENSSIGECYEVQKRKAVTLEALKPKRSVGYLQNNLTSWFRIILRIKLA